MPIRRIDDEAINRLVINADKTRAKADAALDQLLVNGIENKITIPGLHPLIKRFVGESIIVNSRVAPVPAAACPQSTPPT